MNSSYSLLGIKMAAGKAFSAWAKLGKQGSDPVAPGSYGGYVKMRKPPSAYPTTEIQKKIGAGGRAMGVACKGKKGAEFRVCRHEKVYQKK